MQNSLIGKKNIANFQKVEKSYKSKVQFKNYKTKNKISRKIQPIGLFWK